ncbi:alcohol dehydrogenase catalytic domain-containing protein [Cryobacterium sp.]|nr:alcohol dehydrogenase catalytic domain-containing protein [Cryobacterium sp.]MCU1446335.1 threonine dehydrogenase [Cryobacterium sp.]
MLTANYVGNQTIDVREAEPQAPAAGMVQIKVAYAGICGTDLHILLGHMD